MNENEVTKPGSRRFPKRCRVLKRADFLAIQSNGKKISGKHLLLCILTPLAHRDTNSEGRDEKVCRSIGSTDNKPYQFGITVSRKTLRHAVDRNKIKRRLREILRNDVFPVLDGEFVNQEKLDDGHRVEKSCILRCVLIVRSGAHELTFQELRGEVLALCRRGKLIS